MEFKRLAANCRNFLQRRTRSRPRGGPGRAGPVPGGAFAVLPVKSYVIGLIEIDPAHESTESWVTVAGDDETLDSLLARLAGSRKAPAAQPRPSGEVESHGNEPATFAQIPPAGRRGCPDGPLTAAQRVPAALADLAADLADSLAAIRGRLAAASV